MAFQLVYSFDADPRFPKGALVEAGDGNLYGPANGGTWGRDAIYQFTTLGALRIIFSFDGTNGCYPSALVQGPDGSLYGTTYYGGNGYDGTAYSGKGTLFKLSLDGRLTTLVKFNGTNGTGPTERLTLGTDGSFYGTTFTGGSIYDGQYNFGCGSVFQLSPQGGLTPLASFGSTNGVGPHGVVEGKDGNLYGVTQDGGDREFGTFFRVTRNGSLTTLLSFNGTNGLHPRSIIAGTDSNFYGITLYGGPGFTGSDFTGNGTVFKITPAGAMATRPGDNLSKPPKAASMVRPNKPELRIKARCIGLRPTVS
jgi:uncharacterized repeat protein (TIGR03803 family)